MADRFFNDGESNTPQDEQKFSVGDKEYTQDELQDLVTRGNFAKEVEEKFNTKLDKVVPDYTRASQEAAEYKKQITSLEAERSAWQREQVERKAAEGQQLTQEELTRKIRDDAVKFGLATDETVPAIVRAEIEGYELRKVTDSIIDELDDMGIKSDTRTLLRYMEATQNSDSPINNPKDAAESLFGPQIKAWKENEVKNQQPDGWTTQRGGGAGATRTPQGPSINRNTSETDLLRQFRAEAGLDND